MNREEKIKWYEEILNVDPSSKFYFQLAKLYIEEGFEDKAISILKSGLDKHPEDLEARFLLSELLIKKEEFQEATKEIEIISSVLKKYPLFWKHWFSFLTQNQQEDLGIAVGFLACFFNENKINWDKILISAINSILMTGTQTIYPQKDSLKEQSEKKELPFMTKTMAEILESQGDYQEAISIYKEILAKSSSQKEREEISQKIKVLEQKASLNQTKDKRLKKKKFVDLLEKLIFRLQKKMGMRYEA